MFSEKKERTGQEPSSGQNRINEGTTLEGDVVSQGFFRIDGTVKGTIKTLSLIHI